MARAPREGGGARLLQETITLLEEKLRALAKGSA